MMPDSANKRANLAERVEQRTGVTLYREVQIELAQTSEDARGLVDVDARTVTLSFSSDAPLERWGDVEILDHKPSSVRMDRFKSGTAALLIGHGDAREQVGVIEDAWLDGGKARARARFGRSALAEEIMTDVDDGIRRLVSVGYIVHRWEVTQNANAPWEFRATDWEPVEVSIVPVPADASVGVGEGRALGERDNEGTDMKGKTDIAPDPGKSTDDVKDQRDVGRDDNDDTRTDTRTDDQVIADADRERECMAMRTLAKRFNMGEACEALISADGTLDDMKRAIREKVVNEQARAVPTGIATSQSRGDVRVSGGRPMVSSKRARDLVERYGEEDVFTAGMWARATLLQDPRALEWVNERGVFAYDDKRDKMIRSGVEGIFSKGGALVPEEMSSMIIDLREEYGIARQWCQVHPMASDALTVPKRTGGVTAHFVGEEEEPTESDKSWTDVGLVARKLGAQCKFSSEYSEDAVIDVGADFAAEISYAFAEKEDDCLFNGDGTSTYGGITGVRVKIIDGTHGAGAVDAASGHDTFAEIDVDDLSNLMAALPLYAEGGAAWYGSRPCKALVWDALAQAAGGTTMMMIGERPRPSYLGYPIAQSQKMPTSTADLSNVAMLLFGDMSRAVLFGDRRGLRVRLLTERYAEKDQLAVIGFERFDINAHSLGDGTTAGPLVALIGE